MSNGCMPWVPIFSLLHSMLQPRKSSTEPEGKGVAEPAQLGGSIGRFCSTLVTYSEPKKFGAHIIVGMGETERDVL